MGIIDVSRIPNSLRRARKIAGFTQRQVARKLGIQGTSRISRWEKGLSVPNVTNLLKLSILYRVMPHELYHDYISSLSQELLSDALTYVSENDGRYINHADEFS
jgi:transcriptional regulator with XRE-family HTH domain